MDSSSGVGEREYAGGVGERLTDRRGGAGGLVDNKVKLLDFLSSDVHALRVAFSGRVADPLSSPRSFSIARNSLFKWPTLMTPRSFSACLLGMDAHLSMVS